MLSLHSISGSALILLFTLKINQPAKCMVTGKDYIDSGILEQYVLGNLSPEQSATIAQLAATDAAIRKEIDAIEETIAVYAMEHAIAPDPVLKPFLLATIDYTERIRNGEPVSEPPLLHEKSVVADYAMWLSRKDMTPVENELVHAKIIGYTPTAVTAIVWLKDGAPQEVHDHQIEKFLVVEGTCNVIVEDEVHALAAGDYFAIPLHKSHIVKVTSALPCKIILQRVAA